MIALAAERGPISYAVRTTSARDDTAPNNIMDLINSDLGCIIEGDSLKSAEPHNLESLIFLNTSGMLRSKLLTCHRPMEQGSVKGSLI